MITRILCKLVPYIATGATKLDQLHIHPRFIAILEKMNLPVSED